MAKLFEGKIALVTGAGSGIGKATALAFAREGAKVVVSDHHDESGEETMRQIHKKGEKAVFIHCDVSKSVDVNNLINKALESCGRLDCAFNNAGIEGISALTPDCTEENWEKTIGVNLKGAWLCMKYEIPEMLKHGGGSIVNCASIAGLVGFPGIPAYVASKHGIVGLTKTAALEYAKSGIRVNAVCPGVIQTPMIERFTKGQAQAYAQLLTGEPVARLGKPEDIAEAVLWLSSSAASFVTGHSLVVDGGWVAQ